jgi:hypothetical protein
MKPVTWLASLVWMVSLIWVQTISRTEFVIVWCGYSIAFAAYAWLLFSKKPIILTYGLILAVVARLISLFFEPQLSDDYYRFIWDGMVMHQGVHPMRYTPSFLIQHPEIARVPEGLYRLLNSKDYYSVYPPLTQWIYFISYKLNGMNLNGHVVFYKLLSIAVDLLILFLLHLLLKNKKLPPHQVLWYALNPLVILEFTGNLHMDGLMIAMLLAAILFAEYKNVLWSSFLMAFSIASKLLTLMLMPFMPRKLYWKRMILFAVLTLTWSAVIFWFSFGKNTGWLESVQLWFTSFEFNASIYYLVRFAGYKMVGYNAIGSIGPVLALFTLASIGVLFRMYMLKNTFDWTAAMLYALTLYFLLSTTVHPWYLGMLVALSVLSFHIYPMVWAYLIYLSYSHYEGGFYAENYYLIGLEYFLLMTWMWWECRWKKDGIIPAAA